MEFRGKKIRNSPFNPRLETQDKGMEQLEKSIRITKGILQRIVLRDKSEYWEVLLGHRRIKVLETQGVKELKDSDVDIKEVSDQEACEIVTAEGLAHEDLSYIEKGKTCKDLMNTFPENYQSERELAKALGFHQSKITDWINSYEAWRSASASDKTLAQEVEIISKPKKQKGTKSKNILSSETFKEITTTFKGEPKKVAEATKESAKRGVTRSQIRTAKKVMDKDSTKTFSQALDIAQGKTGIQLKDLAFNEDLVESVILGNKTQTIRGKSYGFIKGQKIKATSQAFATLEIIDVIQKDMNSLTDADAQKDGFKNLKDFRKYWEQNIGEWKDSKKIWLYKFKKC